MALQELKKRLLNHDFQSLVTGISDEIDTSIILLIWLKFIQKKYVMGKKGKKLQLHIT